MIEIKKNEQYNSLSVNIDKKSLCDFDKQTGQFIYRKHTIRILTELQTKTKQTKFGEQVFGWFKGTLDNGEEQITFFFNDKEIKTLDYIKATVGDKIEISGGFYTSKKGEFKTCVNMINLSKQKKENKTITLHPLVFKWNNHFEEQDNQNENTIENFIDTFLEDSGLTEDELKRLYETQVIKK